ncbi:uncharacterized protein At1g15400-like [Amaranthus tricolor]|uniref:uncharacterized protein At1g15400-like n=1 Tax=Amaranthus tricolor TaxID=29722 RepID=UPI0025831A89|nr:uncharacterized protein At1g15400-like [Amaranthus tricolor]
MEGLQRSAISFRRQGSSGLVFDDKLISEELSKNKSENQKGDSDQSVNQEDNLISESRGSKSDGGNRRAYRSVKVEQAEDPPSPRVSGCGLCSVFGKPAAKNQKRKTGKSKNK